ncbi:DUF1570 domain-containing protein [Erythrobacter sp. AP23]|uniref:DUF1570 domain-containing protein n=1 Tax=Erythrobacter sp. AP23 TaxID=499656 RepID=UPI00076C4117|nr:DUF1570 domain-containing protein [Erythrobacter sp. AP23]KWV95343.1 hypothetical protein ASS64_04915 [Erythrobacter sp. AP23]
MFRILAAIAALSLAVPAHADWHVAESDNFVIYADDRWQDVQEFGEALERYHTALDLLNGREASKPSPSNRVTIFVVGDQGKIRKLLGDKSGNVAGFYLPRAGGSRAFVPSISMRGRETDFSVTVLLHEYAHHYLMSTSRYAMPRWVSEGAAEFFASAKFDKDGSLAIGRPAYHRAAELHYARDVSVRELMDPKLYEEKKGKRLDAFYGRSWALYHFLFFSEERRGQLRQYITEIAQGTDQREAADNAFGDLDELQKDLDRYLKQRRMNVFDLPADLLPTNPVHVRELSEGEAEVMPLRIRSQRGVSREEALELLPDLREVAAEYPDDPMVLAALAEAEFDAGNNEAAIAAADRALAIDPTVKNALVQKGLALFDKAVDAEDPDVAYAAAMKPFSALNRLEQDHPLPLIHYYRSFVQRGEAPNETARHALERAAQLSPFDLGLAMNAGLMQAREGKIVLARHTLGPVAANPHGGHLAREAQRHLDELAKVSEGTQWTPRPQLDLTDVLSAVARRAAEEEEAEGE